MLEEIIGKKSGKVKNRIERGAVKKFVEALGNSSPLFTDEEAGKRSRYGRNIAPPTFPVTFDGGSIPGLHLPDKGLIHGEQNYHYTRPLFVGEEVHCWREVKDYYEKTGNFGRMGFLIVTFYGEDASGQLLFSEERIVIINEAARREMEA
ncbi:dehydratase [Planococcus salinarum]|uniref:Dehydratase n=1 Tax=Planococcus salinarum TaxID=622695 RepID=A0ABX3D1T1_9BACL|nr:MaoC family dehydratase N-terminal domain-containing protein [Planococcus salinarum]OHX53900.1 dehydratase [Planococcus salinarum]TAA73409.1 MaoC family dehydratase [Planococcus salinarum]